ncbi:unnamed protein product, partial [marine sediment metagenome]
IIVGSADPNFTSIVTAYETLFPVSTPPDHDDLGGIVADNHHARYADAEAIAAAKTVKLDDFATPDDNADLNASITRHGLFKKLDNVIDHFLNGKGNWIEVVGEAATKEFFVPFTFGSDHSKYSYQPAYVIDTSAKYANTEFYVPHDFSTIVEAVVVYIPHPSGTHRLNYYSEYCASGEAHNTHAENLLDQDNIDTQAVLFEWDISALFSALAADDYVAIGVAGDAVNIPKNYMLGVRFKYT